MDSQDNVKLPLMVVDQTHQGNVREVNEDASLVAYWPDGSALLAVIADGMGGHSGGKVAAKIAIDVFGELLLQPLPADRKGMYKTLLERFYVADAAIKDEAAGDPSLIGMGTTLIAAIVTQSEFLHLHAGDCRLYHFGQRDEVYVTADHTVMRVLLEMGQITKDQVAQHPMRSVVTSCLGGNEEGRLSVDPRWEDDNSGAPVFRALAPGDILLLSSDGFHSQVDEDIPARLAMEFGCDIDKLAKDAVSVALEAGGEDNITVIAIRWDGGMECSQCSESLLTTGKLIPDKSCLSDVECSCGNNVQAEHLTVESGNTKTCLRSFLSRILSYLLCWRGKR